MELSFRKAQKSDITGCVNLLSEDSLGIKREDISRPLNQKYYDAFEHINQDPNNELVIFEKNGYMVGMLQLTFIPYLTHIGSWRCMIEGVRIERSFRSQGLGTKFIQWAIDRAKERNCNIVQLTSDKQRGDALRFYETLGFQATHEGYKLKL